MCREFIAITLPGETGDEYWSRGKRAWVMARGEKFPKEIFLKHSECVYNSREWMPTHDPEIFLEKFPPEPGGEIEAMAIRRRFMGPDRRPHWHAVAYPGQSEEVRVGLGITAWVVNEPGGRPYSISLTWRERPHPLPTHTPAELLAEFPPRPGGSLEATAIKEGFMKAADAAA